MSRKKEPINLVMMTYTKNGYGESVGTRSEREILAERKSVKHIEFYQARAAGFAPTITFVIWSAEYQQETLLSYNGQDYKIVRTYDTDEKNTELVCELLQKGAPT